jgi:hypothetical protein
MTAQMLPRSKFARPQIGKTLFDGRQALRHPRKDRCRICKPAVQRDPGILDASVRGDALPSSQQNGCILGKYLTGVVSVLPAGSP